MPSRLRLLAPSFLPQCPVPSTCSGPCRGWVPNQRSRDCGSQRAVLSGSAGHVSRCDSIFSAVGVSAFAGAVCTEPSAPAACGRSSRVHCISRKHSPSSIMSAGACLGTAGFRSSPAFCSEPARKMPARGTCVVPYNTSRHSVG